MNSILTEPSLLSYDLYLNQNQHSIENFKKFIKNLGDILNFLEQNKMRIALSKDLYGEILKKIPTEIYQNKPPYSLAKNLYSRKFHRFVKCVHERGDHNLTINFNSSLEENNSLIDTECYILWKDLIGVIERDLLQKEFIKSEDSSAFQEEEVEINLTNKDGNCKKSYLKSMKKDEILEKSKTLWLIKYIKEMEKIVKITVNVECKSTGDHGNMWNHGSIATINDVPTLERRILKKLIELKSVKEIKFLDFSGTKAPVSKAFLEIKNIEDNCMLCLLRGKGDRKNCQNIKILFQDNFSEILGNIFETEITEEKIEKLIAFNC